MKESNLDEEQFDKEKLNFFLPKSFKGLSKEYILDKLFDNEIQNNWNPQIGDIIVGSTGNIFVISNKHNSVEELGGTLFFFNGVLCNRSGGNILNETISSTMNQSGLWFYYDEQMIIKTKYNPYHTKIANFRYVPYPHEL